ncbi:MAG: SLATT domain-containing protein [Polyangiales bacterium]
MSKGKNITRDEPLDATTFAAEAPLHAATAIYHDAVAFSRNERGWYWDAIKQKKWASRIARSVSFVLGVAGVVAPLIAAIAGSESNKLLVTQLGVAALATAGLAQLGDKVFGWSSGWLRYMTTVTAMEHITLQFELAWASQLIKKSGQLDASDVELLFALARDMKSELEKRRSEETNAWVAEFNAGMAALNEAIRFQKEAGEKAVAASRSAVESSEVATRTGALEVLVTQARQPPAPITIYLGEEKAKTFRGGSWSRVDLRPGQYALRAVANDGTADAYEQHRVLEVAPGQITSSKLELP